MSNQPLKSLLPPRGASDKLVDEPDLKYDDDHTDQFLIANRMIALWHHKHTFQFVNQVENIDKPVNFTKITDYLKLIFVSRNTLLHLPHHFLILNLVKVLNWREHLHKLNESILAVVSLILGSVLRDLGLDHNVLYLCFIIY